MPTEIVDGVYDITIHTTAGGKRYRTFLFDGERPTLVDTGLAERTDALFDGIAEIGLEPERLVVTHGDGDHIGGFDDVVEEYDVETWVPSLTDDSIIDNTPDHRYGDGDAVARFTAVHTPGHEPDNHALVDERVGIAVMGDAVCGSDQRGLPAGYFHLPPAVHSKDLNQAEESLERLLEYSFDVGLVFHGTSVTEGADQKLNRYVNIPE